MKTDNIEPPYNGKWRTKARTVGELIRTLRVLPENMPVEQGFGNHVDVAVMHDSHDRQFVEFEDPTSNE